MTTVRIIPCLDVADGRVVKGVNFRNLVDKGDPVALASHYYLESADELTFLDVNASVEDRSAILDVVTNCAENVFIPLTVGGGVRTVEDVSRFLAAGADKVSVGSAGISNPDLLAQISAEHGSQVLVISLDLKRAGTKSGFGVTTHGGRNLTELDAFDWVRKVIDLGVGELLVNSIDADGTREGFDIELLERVREISPIPLIASGGAGRVEHFVEAARSGADAILAASVFHDGLFSIKEVKAALNSADFLVRT